MHDGKYSESAITYAGLALKTDVSPVDNLPWVQSFESQFAKYFDMNYAISVNSGTSGLHAALLAAGVGPGDEVISPALTVIMDAFATSFTGAEPVFADVEEHSWNIDPRSVEKLITNKTKAIISVSWFGLPAKLAELSEIAKKNNLILIDDSAETMLPKDLRPADWDKCDIRVFSFESKKHMSTGGEGGMMLTNSAELAEKSRKYAGLGYKHLSASIGRTSLASRVFQNPNYIRFDRIGFNYRMTPVAAAIGLGQLEELNAKLALRRECASKFLDAVKGASYLIPQKTPQGITNSFYTFGIYFDEENAPCSWQDFYDKFAELGGDGYYANCMNPYLEPAYKGGANRQQSFTAGLCPKAEKLQRGIMALKTNYSRIEHAERQAEILTATIEAVKNSR